jgi:hypothetical protein
MCHVIQPVEIGMDLVRLCVRAAMEIGLPHVHKFDVIERSGRSLE